MEQMLRCDNCENQDGDENCIEFFKELGEETPCIYVIECNSYKPRENKTIDELLEQVIILEINNTPS